MKIVSILGAFLENMNFNKSETLLLIVQVFPPASMPNLKLKYEMDFNDLPTFPETHTSFQLLGLVASNCIDLPKYGGIVVGDPSCGWSG